MRDRSQPTSGDFFLHEPPPAWLRPAGLGTLGARSYIEAPYTIRSPHRVHIGDDVRIGARTVLSVVEEFMGSRFDSELRIGDGCEFGRDVFITCVGKIEFGERVGLSTRVFIGDTDRAYDRADLPIVDQPMAEPRPVRIENDAALGVGSIVVPGVTIGERAIVAAGSVVTRDVPPRTVVFGNPARVVKHWDEKQGQWIGGPPRGGN
jgi:acetyltransferase-like isoleucine patch superfamily enzyme